MERGGQNYFYHADGLGSITAITNSTGSVVSTYRYDAFGNIILQTGTLANPYTYTGREYDSETNLYYYRARYYDARIGRFLQEDRFLGLPKQPQSLNLYAYVMNNSINYSDPLGYARGDWWDYKTYYPDLKEASRIADDVLLNEAPATRLPGAYNGLQDAWRHARWSERMKKEINFPTAFIAGYGHELKNLYDQLRKGKGIRWDEFWMDLHNNREGRSGKNAWDLLKEGRLSTINPKCPTEGGLY